MPIKCYTGGYMEHYDQNFAGHANSNTTLGVFTCRNKGWNSGYCVISKKRGGTQGIVFSVIAFFHSPAMKHEKWLMIVVYLCNNAYLAFPSNNT